jgi:ubiquinone/menaquinone biosynthesis C-methylase UbiE
MKNKEAITELFEENKQEGFDFSRYPDLIRRKKDNTQKIGSFKKDDLSKWTKAQRGLVHWTNLGGVFSNKSVGRDIIIRSSFFKERGFLKGSVLDIGGGWGLYRQWWEPNESDFYIVHDPGIDRFLHGAHKAHKEHYQRAFSLPMTFVEGFGEELPYRNEIFDTCLIASTLDHCVSPEKVLAEAYRCLKGREGVMLILQRCDTPQRSTTYIYFLKRLLKILCEPKRLLSEIYHRLFFRVGHLHHFSDKNIVMLLEQAGFCNIKTSIVAGMGNFYAFEAKKERGKVERL